MPEFVCGRAAEAAKVVCKEPKILLFVLLTDIFFNIVHTRSLRTIVCRPGARESVPATPIIQASLLADVRRRQHRPDRRPTHGYEPTREVAMAAFRKGWRRES
jgi:hypothetical protein